MASVELRSKVRRVGADIKWPMDNWRDWLALCKKCKKGNETHSCVVQCVSDVFPLDDVDGLKSRWELEIGKKSTRSRAAWLEVILRFKGMYKENGEAVPGSYDYRYQVKVTGGPISNMTEVFSSDSKQKSFTLEENSVQEKICRMTSFYNPELLPFWPNNALKITVNLSRAVAIENELIVLTGNEDMLLTSPTVTCACELLLNSPFMSDATMICREKNFYAHQLILSARSVVFKAMFETSMKEKQTKSVDMREFTTEAVERMLIYIYTGQVILPQGDDKLLVEILYLSEMYSLIELVSACLRAMRETIKDANAGDFALAAHLLSESNADSEFIRKYVIDNHSRLLESIKGYREKIISNPAAFLPRA